jgi:hypothetical protein
LYEEEVGGIDEIRVCRNATSVSYLLLADDYLILMKPNVTNATSLQKVLDTFMYGGMVQMGWVCQL